MSSKRSKLLAWSALVAGLSVATGLSIPLPELSPEDECALYVKHTLDQLPKGKPALIPYPPTSFKLCVDRMRRVRESRAAPRARARSDERIAHGRP